MYALVSGCAGRYHTEFVGHGTAIVQPRTLVAASNAPAQPDEVVGRSQAPWAVGGGIQVPAGTYDLALAFDVPRAQEIEWTVSCPGVQQSGIAGETFERYRERRVAELHEQVRRDRERTAAVTSAVVGTFAPRVVASGQAGPVTVHQEARVNADAVGDAVAENAIPDEVMLPIGDVGRGRLAKNVHVTTTGAGMCVVTAIADDADVLATYRVTRVRDLDAEARLAVMATRSAGMSVRAKLQARLVAHGADAELRQREERAAIEARYAAEANAHAELEIRTEQEEQWRIMALHARAQLRGRCEGNGADPDRRQRIADEQRIAEEARVRLQADIEQRRLELALGARTSLRHRWTRLGAIARPPMPELLAENPGIAPFDGAVWIDGKWVWMNGRWTWVAGGWSDPDVFTEVGGDGHVEVVEDGGSIIDDPIIDLGVGVGVGVGATREAVRDHRRPRPKREQFRDHRDGRSPRNGDVRDHRSQTRETWTPTRTDPPPATRDDHKRDDERREDKRDDNKDDDRGRFTRDHRR
ncbi:MAG: hypothetical protein ACKV2T_30310 [Kofleriaceae bacterium]